MRTDLHFRGIRRSEYIEDFISDKVLDVTEHVLYPDSDTHITVRLDKDKNRTSTRHPIYQCEVTLKSGMSSRTYVVSKQDRNFFRAVIRCFDTLKIMLSKTHDRARNDRRRRRLPEFTSAPLIESTPLIG